MTFLKLVNDIKQKYATNNNVVIFEILFKTSKLIKSKIDFLTYRNKQIDFKSERIYKYLDAYFYKNKPLGQIVRHTKFCGIKIDIYKNIFEPRSETELITEKIIEYLKHNHKLINGVDLCCGTGCIGLAIKKHCT
jgi:methylase of polypeptide subunit release factors